MYKIVFHDPSLSMIGNDHDRFEEEQKSQKDETSRMETRKIPEKSIDAAVHKTENKSLKRLINEMDRFEDLTASIDATRSSSNRESIAEAAKCNDQQEIAENLGKIAENGVDLNSESSSSSISSNGSMRKKKEWKRTLGCKLFEERHNAGREEGMDLLWEVQEKDHSSIKSMNRKEAMIEHKKKQMMIMKKKKNKSEINLFDHEDEDEFLELWGNAQLCCLQALNLSEGKMDMGMGKHKVVKISKALKGFGWFHHLHLHK